MVTRIYFVGQAQHFYVYPYYDNKLIMLLCSINHVCKGLKEQESLYHSTRQMLTTSWSEPELALHNCICAWLKCVVFAEKVDIACHLIILLSLSLHFNLQTFTICFFFLSLLHSLKTQWKCCQKIF